MATIQNDARLFGLDLSGVLGDLKIAWRGMLGWRVLAWLRPEPVVRWLRANRQSEVYRGGRKHPRVSPAAAKAARFAAVEVPEDLLLRHVVQLPPLPSAASEGALLLEVQNLSPFPGEELLWVSSDINGRESDGGQAALSQRRRIAVVLASRSMVQAHLAAMPSTEATASNAVSPEVWVDMGNGRPAVLPGFGETRRLGYQRRWQRVNAVMCVGTVLLLVGVLVTPTLQLRLRALDAVDQYTALQKQVAPLIQQREAYVKAQALLQALPDSAVPSGAALQILDMITRALPDDTSLQSFQLAAPEGPGKPPKVFLVGQTGNAAALMQQLGVQPGFKDVKAPSAAVKPLGAIKESFSIELLVDLAQARGLTSASPSPSMPTASSGAKP